MKDGVFHIWETDRIGFREKGRQIYLISFCGLPQDTLNKRKVVLPVFRGHVVLTSPEVVAGDPSHALPRGRNLCHPE